MDVIEEIIIQQESVNDENVIITKLFFNDGDAVKKGDIILDIETSKSTLSIEVGSNGFIEYYCSEGESVRIGYVVSKIFDKYPKKTQVSSFKNEKEQNKHSPISKTIFSKKAKQLIERNNMQDHLFQGKDFVNEKDVQLILNPNSINHQSIKKSKQLLKNILPNNKDNVYIEKLSSQKIREIEYLSAIQPECFNSSMTIYIDVEEVLDVVNTHMSLLKGSFLPLIIYETAKILKKFPKINAYYENQSIVYYNNINIGIAIDIDNGLKVLKIKNSNELTVYRLEREILNISKKYIENNIAQEDLSNITFTITDLSGSEISSFIPLVNKNNSAILAISSLDKKLNRFSLTMTFDHRVTEGKYVSSFLSELKNRVESFAINENDNSRDVSTINCYKCHRNIKNNLKDNITFFNVKDLHGKNRVLCSICYENY